MYKPEYSPPQFSTRPATWDDLHATVAFLNDTDEHDFGKRNFSPEGLATDWKIPAYLENSTRIVFNSASQIVGYAEAYQRSQPPVKTIVFGRTHPDYRGLGLGTSFLQWGETIAQANIDKCPASARVFLFTLTVAALEPARALFEDFGMHPVRAFVRMQKNVSSEFPVRPFPPGFRVQPYRHDEDLLPLHVAYEEAFAKNWLHTSQSVEAGTANLRGWVENDSQFDASLWLLVWDDQEVAGFILAGAGQGEHAETGEVYELGVRPRWQKRGLGQALLQQMFQELRGRGIRSVTLDVDADPASEALGFYEKMGMSVMTRRIAYEKTLRDGANNQD